MKAEYFLFNLFVLAGPFALSFDKKVNFKQYWPIVFPSIVFGSLFHLIWDYFAAGHFWHYNPRFIFGLYVGSLPVEEILFFITVSYAVLFTWEVFLAYFPNKSLSSSTHLLILISLCIPAAYYFRLSLNWTYTALVFLIMALALCADILSQNKHSVWNQRLWYSFLFLFFVMVLIANGYLTARPVVEYYDTWRSGIRLFTIPVEDFLFGLSHISIIMTIYSYLKSRKYHG